MKNIIDFIKEKYSDENNIFNDISVNDFEWKSAYSDDDYQEKCKKEVKKLADELYKDIKPYLRVEQLFRDTYRQYLLANTKNTDKQISEQYDSQIKNIDKYGWAQFESTSLEQGWWVFMCWVKNKKL